jgi:membrane fusion protein (multidrug efflux system)
MTVDESSVDRIGEIEYVWVVERGRAEKRRVLTGARENGQVEIVAGLQPGQIVVTSGQIKLSDGAKVKISNMPDPSVKAVL